MVYTDDEGSLNSKLLQDYFKEQNIRHITTRTHAAVAERAVRTIKDLIYQEIGKEPIDEVVRNKNISKLLSYV
jgi:tartrate dehydratase beta subunit/fumarate hydratase class I family protein